MHINHMVLRQICDDGLKTIAAEIQSRLKDSGQMDAENILHDLQHMGYGDVAAECASEWDMEV